MTDEQKQEYEKVDRPAGLLTTSQREFITQDIDLSGGRIRERRRHIRTKIHNAILDFSLLMDHLPEKDRKQLFDVGDRQRGLDPFEEFSGSLADLIQFVYAGTEGPPWFNKILSEGVKNGEVTLGTVKHAPLVNPSFSVEYATPSDAVAAANHVKNEEWEELSDADLYSFIRAASKTDAFDIGEMIEEFEQNREIKQWFKRYRAGKKQTRIPGGKWTPFIEREIWDKYRFGKIPAEYRERIFRELFEDGHNRGTRAIYDGEKVFLPPAAGSDDEPEILYWVHEKNS